MDGLFAGKGISFFMCCERDAALSFSRRENSHIRAANTQNSTLPSRAREQLG